MVSAREQARGAVRDRLQLFSPNEGMGHSSIDFRTAVEEGADAASAVWEPLLEDLLFAYEHAVKHGGKGHFLHVADSAPWASTRPWGAYARAKEALGD